MANAEIKTVDQYIAAQPEPARSVLRRVRTAIRRALPGAEELISYKIPTYRLRGVPVLYFAGWAQHYSLYPVSADVVAEVEEARVPHEVSKGTLRFPLSRPAPVTLIGRIAKLRAKEATARPRHMRRASQRR